MRYKRAGRTGADGGLLGATKEGFVDSSRGVVSLRLDRPGRWVVVARAKGYTASGGGQFFPPWSPVGVIQGIAPFDIRSLRFPDSRGPSYQLRGQIGEPSARGVVRISIAPAAAAAGSARSAGPSSAGTPCS